jgi:hypothetical protein
VNSSTEFTVTQSKSESQVTLDRQATTRPVVSRIAGGHPYHRLSYMKCVSIQNIFGDEVDYTIFVLLPVNVMLCSKLHRQKSFKSKHISYDIPVCVGQQHQIPGA